MSNLIGINDGAQSRPSPIQVNPFEHPTVVCESCGGKIFDIAFVVKKINKMAIGAPVDQMVPIQLFRCSDCGEVLKDSLPNPKLLEDE